MRQISVGERHSEARNARAVQWALSRLSRIFLSRLSRIFVPNLCSAGDQPDCAIDQHGTHRGRNQRACKLQHAGDGSGRVFLEAKPFEMKTSPESGPYSESWLTGGKETRDFGRCPPPAATALRILTYLGFEHLHVVDGSTETRERAANHVDSATVRYAIGFSAAHDNGRVRSPCVLDNVVQVCVRGTPLEAKGNRC